MKSLPLGYNWIVAQSQVLALHGDWLFIRLLKLITNHSRGGGIFRNTGARTAAATHSLGSTAEGVACVSVAIYT